MNNNDRKRRYFYGLDAIRFSAAIMVVLFHLGRSINGHGSRGYVISQGKLESSVAQYVSWGSVGVEIFFVISGLVIANSAIGSSAFDFLRSRAERLYPAAWFCATISFLVWTINGRTNFHVDLFSYLKSMTLMPFGPWIDAPYWTLGHEIIFYTFVWFILLCGQIKHIEKLAIGIAAIATIHWTCRAIQQLTDLHVAGISFMESGVARLFFPIYGGYFALGIFLWLYFNSRISRIGWLFSGLAFLSAIAPYCLSFLRTDRIPEGMVVWLIGFAAIIIASFYPSFDTQECWSKKQLRRLGLATYPLYLLHYALGGYMMRQLVELGMAVDLALGLVIIALIVISILIATYIEPILRRTLRGYFNRAELHLYKLRRA